jgi:hypothetical protein
MRIWKELGISRSTRAIRRYTKRLENGQLWYIRMTICSKFLLFLGLQCQSCWLLTLPFVMHTSP